MKAIIQLITFMLLCTMVLAQENNNEISPNYLPFDEENWQLLAYEPSTGLARLSFTGNKPSFVAGKTVTTLMNDTIGYFLRKIIAVEERGQELLLTTEFADMTDVFINKSFTLSTAVISPQTSGTLKSAQAISDAFTDAQGVIHPCAYIVHKKSPEGKKTASKTNLAETHLLKSVDESRLNIITIAEYLNDMDLYASGGFRFFIEEGELSFKADAVFNFEFKGAAPQNPDEEIESSDLKKFQFYLEGEARAQTNLKMTFESAYTKDDEVELLEDVLSTTVKFMVGPVPVWITFGIDILAAYQFSAEAKVEADWGFDARQNVRIGGEYLTESGELKPIAEKTFSLDFTPLTVNGEANVHARLEVFPRTSMMLYSAAGPYCDVVPYLSADFKAKAMASTSGETDLKWNSSLDWGVDFRAGLQPAFLKSLLGEIGPVTSNLLQQNIWNAPASVGLAMKTSNNYILPTTIPLQFKITDSKRNLVPLAPLFFEASNGSIDKQWAISNSNGIATVNWTLNAGNTNKGTQTQSLSASLVNSEDEMIDKITVVVTVSNTPTAIYVDELLKNDSLVLNNVDVFDMDKGIIGKEMNKGSLVARGLNMTNCGTGLSGTFNEVYIQKTSSFDSCQNSIHLQGLLNQKSVVKIEECRFRNNENLAVKLRGFDENHILQSEFIGCNNAIIAEGDRQAVFELKNSNFQNCNQALNLSGFAMGDVARCKMSLNSQPGQSSIAIAGNDLQQLFLDQITIENYHTGVYGKAFRDHSEFSHINILNPHFGFDLNHFINSRILSSTIRVDHAIDAAGGKKDFIGISLSNSNNNYIARNNLINLCTGITEINCNENNISENRISGSQCDSTGLYSVYSTPKIVNNTFDNNRGAALLLNNPSASIIANNNFMDNAISISNASPIVQIEATGNYFESLADEKVTGTVQLLNNLSEKVALVCDYPPDTLYIPSGSVDSVALHVQNFEDLADSVLVTITDERGWVSGDLFQTGTLSNSTGAIFYTPINTHPKQLKSASSQTSEMIKATVVSAHSGKSASDSIILSIYNQALGTMQIDPDRKTIMAGDSIKFSVMAYDQYGMDMDVQVLWSATGGTINSEGWFMSDGAYDGEILVTAKHAQSNAEVNALIQVTGIMPVLNAIYIDPEIITLLPGEQFRFESTGSDQFGNPYTFDPIWSTSAGIIDLHGWYTAPDSTGSFLVEVSDQLYQNYAVAHVNVQCFEQSTETRVLCGSDSVYAFSRWFTQPGFYTDTIRKQGECDQIIKLEIIQSERPDVTWNMASNTFTTNDAPFTLTGGMPQGGFYSLLGSEIEVFDPSMVEPGNYQLDYTYTNEDGCSATASVIITIENGVGTKHIPALFNVQLYPNPNKGQFLLEIHPNVPNDEALHLSVTNLLGQEVWQCRKLNLQALRETIDLKHLQPGIYHFTLQTDHHKKVIKLMIKR